MHDNEELNGIDKFIYLKSLLKALAQIAVEEAIQEEFLCKTVILKIIAVFLQKS